MLLIGREVLDEASRKYPDARTALDGWSGIVLRAHWQNILDVRKELSSADGVKLPSDTVVTVFNIRGNKYRLLTTINYQAQIVRARDLLTHAEYSKELWKARY
jgi:mRNA interferase HigB